MDQPSELTLVGLVIGLVDLNSAASEVDAIELLELLREEGVRIPHVDDTDCNGAIGLAVFGHLHITRYLVEHGWTRTANGRECKVNLSKIVRGSPHYRNERDRNEMAKLLEAEN